MTDMRLIVPQAATGLTEASPPHPAPQKSYAMALIAVAMLALAAGFAIASGPEAEAAARAAGPDLTRLLRAMAVLKLSFVGLGVWLAALRLRLPVNAARAAAYTAAVAAMAVAPGLIWGMDHVVSGAILLHGGLAALAIVAWTDRGTGPALSAWIARGRARLAPDAPPISR